MCDVVDVRGTRGLFFFLVFGVPQNIIKAGHAPSLSSADERVGNQSNWKLATTLPSWNWDVWILD